MNRLTIVCDTVVQAESIYDTLRPVLDVMQGRDDHGIGSCYVVLPEYCGPELVKKWLNRLMRDDTITAYTIRPFVSSDLPVDNRPW